MKIACIILAAGKSSRMKQQKMLLPFNGCSIIENVCKASIHAEIEKTYVLTGNNGPLIAEAIKDLPVQIIHNPEFEKGMLSSVQKGVEAAQKYEAFFVLPGDQPFITSLSFNRLISAYKGTDRGLIIPTFNGRKGHPVLIKSTYSEQISQLDHNIGLRQLFHENKDDVKLVDLNSDEILIDLDYPADYHNAIKRLNNEK